MYRIIEGNSKDILNTFDAESIDCVVTSPPYWNLRDYKTEGQLGQEKTFQEYIKNLCDIFDEVKRVLKKGGVVFVNIGDTYSTISGSMGKGKWKQPKYEVCNDQMPEKLETGLPTKCLCQIPSRFVIEMIDRGWTNRNEIIWWRRNQMPQSVKDRFTVDFEKIYMLTKNAKYYFEQQLEPYTSNPSEKEMWRDKSKEKHGDINLFSKGPRNYYSKGGRNMRCVWDVPTKPFKGSHYATFPEDLVKPMILAGCPKGGVVLDPFSGAGTTLLVAEKLGRDSIGIELNPEYIEIAKNRIDVYSKQYKLF